MKDTSFIVYCSNCEKALVDIWIINDAEMTTKFRACCPHCGDKSYWKTIKGKFSMGTTEETNLGPLEYTENTVEVQCRKK
jgi:endogenous inhibitor of DNA gyrase (YacG/DUF329 family)